MELQILFTLTYLKKCTAGKLGDQRSRDWEPGAENPIMYFISLLVQTCKWSAQTELEWTGYRGMQ